MQLFRHLSCPLPSYCIDYQMYWTVPQHPQTMKSCLWSIGNFLFSYTWLWAARFALFYHHCTIFFHKPVIYFKADARQEMGMSRSIRHIFTLRSYFFYFRKSVGEKPPCRCFVEVLVSWRKEVPCNFYTECLMEQPCCTWKPPCRKWNKSPPCPQEWLESCSWAISITIITLISL